MFFLLIPDPLDHLSECISGSQNTILCRGNRYPSSGRDSTQQVRTKNCNRLHLNIRCQIDL